MKNGSHALKAPDAGDGVATGAFRLRDAVLLLRPMRSLLLLLFVLMLGTVSAVAHPLLQNVMWVQFEPTRVHVAVNVSVREIAVAQSLAGKEDNFDSTALASAAAKHGDYVLRHLTISANGQALTGKLLQITDPPIL